LQRFQCPGTKATAGGGGKKKEAGRSLCLAAAKVIAETFLQQAWQLAVAASLAVSSARYCMIKVNYRVMQTA
jgi:hypothetical protein